MGRGGKMALKEKRRSPRIGITGNKFSFIAPYPVEKCHARLLSLRKSGWSFPQTSVSIDNIGQQRFSFQITRLIGRGRQVAISGEIAAQTEETTLITGKLQSVPIYWCMAIPL